MRNVDVQAPAAADGGAWDLLILSANTSTASAVCLTRPTGQGPWFSYQCCAIVPAAGIVPTQSAVFSFPVELTLTGDPPLPLTDQGLKFATVNSYAPATLPIAWRPVGASITAYNTSSAFQDGGTVTAGTFSAFLGHDETTAYPIPVPLQNTSQMLSTLIAPGTNVTGSQPWLTPGSWATYETLAQFSPMATTAIFRVPVEAADMTGMNPYCYVGPARDGVYVPTRGFSDRWVRPPACTTAQYMSVQEKASFPPSLLAIPTPPFAGCAANATATPPVAAYALTSEPVGVGQFQLPTSSAFYHNLIGQLADWPLAQGGGLCRMTNQVFVWQDGFGGPGQATVSIDAAGGSTTGNGLLGSPDSQGLSIADQAVTLEFFQSTPPLPAAAVIPLVGFGVSDADTTVILFTGLDNGATIRIKTMSLFEEQVAPNSPAIAFVKIPPPFDRRALDERRRIERMLPQASIAANNSTGKLLLGLAKAVGSGIIKAIPGASQVISHFIGDGEEAETPQVASNPVATRTGVIDMHAGEMPPVVPRRVAARQAAARGFGPRKKRQPQRRAPSVGRRRH